MIKKTDPFTKKPGIAGKAYIDIGVTDEIINNFCDKESAKYIYTRSLDSEALASR